MWPNKQKHLLGSSHLTLFWEECWPWKFQCGLDNSNSTCRAYTLLMSRRYMKKSGLKKRLFFIPKFKSETMKPFSGTQFFSIIIFLQHSMIKWARTFPPCLLRNITELFVANQTVSGSVSTLCNPQQIWTDKPVEICDWSAIWVTRRVKNLYTIFAWHWCKKKNE